MLYQKLIAVQNKEPEHHLETLSETYLINDSWVCNTFLFKSLFVLSHNFPIFKSFIRNS